MITIETTDIEVCTDCILFLANGTCEGCDHCVTATGEQDPTAECQTVARRIADTWGHDIGNLVPGDVDEPWFATTSCQGCGSDQHGDRYRAHLVKREG